MDLWHAIGKQLGNPNGFAGRLVGHAMRWANDKPTRLAIDALAPKASDAILDVGCGPGHSVALLSRLVPDGQVTGVDHSTAMIKQGRQRNARAVGRGQVFLKIQHFNSIAFPEQSFDGIIASNVIYFWPNPSNMISRLGALLRPGGKLVIYATSTHTMQHWKFARTGTHRWIDHPMLLAALIEGGFATDRIEIRDIRLSGNIHGLIAVATAP